MDKKTEMMQQIYSAMVLLNSITTNAAKVASIIQGVNLALMSDEDSASTTK